MKHPNESKLRLREWGTAQPVSLKDSAFIVSILILIPDCYSPSSAAIVHEILTWSLPSISHSKKLVSPCVKPCINHRTTLCGLMIFVLTVKPMFFVAPLLMRNWKNRSRGGWFRTVVVHAGGQHSVHCARKFFLSDHT